MNDLITAAAAYIDMGLGVIALDGKMPNRLVHPRGLKDAYYSDTDADWRRAFRHPDTTGVGILTFPYYFVIDIDGEEGARWWKDHVSPENFLPDRWVAKTSKGLHLWFAREDYVPTQIKMSGFPLDIKGAGGYVAAPPSLHPSGVRYEWIAPFDPRGPMECPPELWERLLRTRRLAELETQSRRSRRATKAVLYPDRTVSHDGLVEAVRKAGPGERNELLNWAAYRAATEGATEAVFLQMEQAAVEAGLDNDEVTKTIESARKAGGHE
jgi:hypothetical protein